MNLQFVFSRRIAAFLNQEGDPTTSVNSEDKNYQLSMPHLILFILDTSCKLTYPSLQRYLFGHSLHKVMSVRYITPEDDDVIVDEHPKYNALPQLVWCASSSEMRD